jgi:mannose-1-phosphate guanylyltransferase
VIPAGGAGTRLWPLSRSAEPKFLHDLTGSGRTLIQATVDRLQPLVEDRMLIITGAAHHDQVQAQLPGLGPAQIVTEPSARDSMAAVGLAAAMLERDQPDAVMGSFAADHEIAQPEAFRAAVIAAVGAARAGWLVTLGIRPTFPSTAFGYLELGEEIPEHDGVVRVRQFVEKPSADVAAQYLATGRFRWNAGMFVVRPGVLLDLLATWHPEFTATLRAIAADPESLADRWASLPRIALDHAVAEPAAEVGRVAAVPADLGWDDIGDFDSLAALVERDDGVLTVVGDPARVYASEASGLVHLGPGHSGRVVALVGLDDIVVVDTPDALLVTSREHAQEVKAIVERLRESGRIGLT